MQIISVWSGPRNVSTALMYSFAQRSDTEVVDEPLYGHYLRNVPVLHPGRDEVLEAMETDGLKVVRELLKAGKKPVRFLKNMAHHWVSLDYDLLVHFTNVLLIRDPFEMLPSLVKQLPGANINDTALGQQVRLFDHLAGKGKRPLIIDSKLLLLNPKNILGALCEQLGIPFYPVMLHWQPGPRPEDGAWAKYWYDVVHASPGFQPYQRKEKPFPRHLAPLLEECKPYYDYLFHYALKDLP